MVFGERCPWSKSSGVELIDEAATEIYLSTKPAALLMQEVHITCDLYIVGTFDGNFVLSDSNLDGIRSLSPESFPTVLYFTHKHDLSPTHLALDDSYPLYFASFPADIFAQEVVSDGSAQLKSTPRRFTKNVKEALSAQFC